MKKWTNGVDVFEEKFIIIPVHERFVYSDSFHVLKLVLILAVLLYHFTAYTGTLPLCATQVVSSTNLVNNRGEYPYVAVCQYIY